MAFWDKAKDASVEARRRDEEYHARALYEIQSGKRRDGLWAKAVTSNSGDEAAAKLTYFKLLVQALKDDDHIALRSFQSLSSSAPDSSTQPSPPPAQKPGPLKVLWFLFLTVVAALMLVFGFLPMLMDGRAGIWQWFLAGVWLLVIYYALNKLLLRAKT